MWHTTFKKMKCIPGSSRLPAALSKMQFSSLDRNQYKVYSKLEQLLLSLSLVALGLLSCFSSFFLAPLDYLKLNYDLPSCLSSSSSSRAKRLKPRLEKLETAFRLLWRQARREENDKLLRALILKVFPDFF